MKGDGKRCPHCGHKISLLGTRAGPVLRVIMNDLKKLRPGTQFNAAWVVGHHPHVQVRQIYSALQYLVRHGGLAKIGYGKFVKPKESP